MATYTLTGPISGVKGVPSTLFTLTPSGSLTDTVNLSDGGAGGTFTPTSLLWAGSSAAKTFTYTSASPGVETLTLTSTGSNTITQSPWTYTSTAAYGWARAQAPVGNFQSPTTSVPVTLSGITAGNYLILGVTTSPSTSPTITDTQSGSWNLIGTNNGALLYYRLITSSGNVTVTVANSSSTTLYLGMAEYSLPPGSTFGVTTANSGTNGSLPSVSMPSLNIAAQSNAAVVIALQASGSSIPGSGFATVQDIRGVSGGIGLYFEDSLNSFGSTVTPTATCPGSGGWHGTSTSFQATMPVYSLIGPSHVASGSPAQFYLVPTGTAVADTVTLSSNLPGTFSPTSLTVTASPLAVPFTFTPSVAGLAMLMLTSSGSHSIGASPWSLGSFVNLSVTGPIQGLVATPYTFTITPAGTTTDTVTYGDGSDGTFAPTSLSFSNSSTAQTVTYTPGSGGSKTLTFTSAVGGTIAGSPVSFVAASVVVGPEIVKSGTLVLFLTASAGGLSNGNWPLAQITAVNANPAFKLNGATASFGPPVWHDSAHDISQVAYRAQCGHVASIPMSNGGHGYTAPTATWNGDGGGSGHTVGTPALATGVTSYTITNPGSGLTDGVTYWNPGTPSGFKAIGYITVSGGAVTSAVPMSGSPISYGAGYTSSFSSPFGANATITCNVSNYISGIPVTNPGTGFTSRPTYTITDSTGAGAVAAPSMRLSASDVVTYTVADNWLSTSLGTVFGATDQVIPNFVGVLEGPTGHVTGFRDTPTTKFGGEYTGQSNQNSFDCWFKNKMAVAEPFTGSGVVLDSNYFPVSWTPGGTITCQWGGAAYGVQAFPFGIYTIVYDDPLTDTTSVALNTPDFTFLDTATVGTTVTQHWRWNGGIPSYALGKLSITSSSGTMKISMPWIFAPGNTIDRSNKFAIDDAYVANFTNSAGTGPASFRYMTQVGGVGFNSMVDVSDLATT